MIAVTTKLYCDFGDCHEHITEDECDVDELMAEALCEGWIFSYGLKIWAYCPKHKHLIDDPHIFEAQNGKTDVQKR